MNSRDIKAQFAAQSADAQIDLSQHSARFADWIAEKSSGLDEADLKLLMRLGGALYAAELEQDWQRCWA